jgi:hypothetical protein
MRLMISQVIGRPPAEVFRFVATEHFQNHPKWDPSTETVVVTLAAGLRSRPADS